MNSCIGTVVMALANCRDKQLKQRLRKVNRGKQLKWLIVVGAVGNPKLDESVSCFTPFYRRGFKSAATLGPLPQPTSMSLVKGKDSIELANSGLLDSSLGATRHHAMGGWATSRTSQVDAFC